MVPQGLRAALFVLIGLASFARADEPSPPFEKLFTKDGPPEGWIVRRWDDVSLPADAGVQWLVKEGVLHGSEPRGTWLMSEREYQDFQLQFDLKLGERGNSGLALRAPLKGDPAFDGLELQMADLRYNESAKPSELTGGLYRAIAPSKQVYRPTEWNTWDITLKGDRVKVVLNRETIQDLDLSKQEQAVLRHNGETAPPIRDRPHRGHIGFQELSRGADHVQIRDARIRVWPSAAAASQK